MCGEASSFLKYETISDVYSTESFIVIIFITKISCLKLWQKKKNLGQYVKRKSIYTTVEIETLKQVLFIISLLCYSMEEESINLLIITVKMKKSKV